MGPLILFVDDDPAVRSAFLFAHEDVLDIITASSGGEALEILSREPRIAVVVTDYKMPGMDGVELAGVIRMKHPGTRIILNSANSSTCAISGCAAIQRMDAFLDKVDPDPKALDKVRAAINSSIRMHKKNEQQWRRERI